MSAQSSFITVPSSVVGDPQPANFTLTHTGSVYRASIPAVADGETQGFAIDEYGRQMVIGGAPDGDAASGNGVRVGGVYRTTPPSYANGDFGTFQIDAAGQLLTRNTIQEAHLAAIEASLDIIDSWDYATETTLAAAAASLGVIEAVDFATEAKQDDILTELTVANASLDDIETAVESLAAEDFATETTLAALNTKAATEAKQDDIIAELQELNSSEAPLSILHSVYMNYASSNLPGNASNILELVASTSAAIKKVQIFDTGGVPFELRTGASAGTALSKYGPGADNEFEIAIPAATRVGIRRLDSASALTGGDLCINFLG